MYQSRGGGAEATVIVPTSPASSSVATAARETNDTPRPARAACLIAPFEPRVIVWTSIPTLAMNSSLTARVPDPGSRKSQRRPASLAAETVLPPASGSSGAVISMSSFARIGCASIRSCGGGRPPMARSASWFWITARTWSRLPTSSARPICGCAVANARMSGGTNDSAAVVTAAIVSVSAPRASASRAACRPCSSRPMTSAAYAANSRPAGVGRTPRPARSSRLTPTSRESAATAAEIAGWVTTSSSAAAVTEPPWTTARKLRSWVSVIDTVAQIITDHLSLIVKVSLDGSDYRS